MNVGRASHVIETIAVLQVDQSRRSTARGVKLLALVDFQNGVRNREDIERQGASACLTQIGAAHGKRRERVALQLAEQVNVGRASHVIETIAVLQIFHLDFEDVVMGRTEITAERHAFLGQAAVPEVDILQTRDRPTVYAGPGTRAEEEIHGVTRRCGRCTKTTGHAIPRCVSGHRTDDGAGRRTSVYKGRGLFANTSGSAAYDAVRTRERGVCPVSRDEVHQSRFVPQIVGVVGPVNVRYESGVPGCRIEHPSSIVEPGVPHVATPRDVDGAEIEWQTDQIVL